jgi:hypothetical protein
VLYLRAIRDGKGVAAALKLPAKAAEGMTLAPAWEQADADADAGAPMVAADGLVYTLTRRALTARDAGTGAEVYRQALAPRFAALMSREGSLALAGGNLYATVNCETWVVKPGKTFAEVWHYANPWGAIESAFAGERQFVRGRDALYCIGGATPTAPNEPAFTLLASKTAPDGAALAPFTSDRAPARWLVAGPFAGRDLKKDYLAGLGGRAAAVPKDGDAATLGGETSTFRAMPDNAWWKDGGRFTNNMDAIIVTGGEKSIPCAAGQALNATVLLSTVVENDVPRYVRFRFLTPDGISWNYKQRLDGRAWLAGQPMDEDTVYKLEKGRYPLLLQMTTGDVEGWGRVWMCPRLVDATPELERKLADYRKLRDGWDAYQASLKKTFVFGE